MLYYITLLLGFVLHGAKMTLKDFKTTRKFKQQDLAFIFRVKRQTIARWLKDEKQIPWHVKFYLNWLG
jgi:transcriptional regulator with XRE-family HTH domain